VVSIKGEARQGKIKRNGGRMDTSNILDVVVPLAYSSNSTTAIVHAKLLSNN